MTPTKLIVPALLCVVALGQITLARYSTLTPWTGGGFGAFASVDHPKNHFLSVVGFDASSQPHTINVPWGELSEPEALTERFARRTLAFPSKTRLRHIADAVLNASLKISAQTEVPPALLLDSPYRLPLEAGIRGGHVVEVVGPYRDEASISGLQRVEVSVLILDFAVQTGRVAFRPLSAYGTMRPDPSLSARRSSR